jgi:phage gpG-like protein
MAVKPFSDVFADIQNIVKQAAPHRADVRSALERQKERIIDRTQEGIDVDGQPFAPYSPGYAKEKASHGLNGGFPDLRWSGEMLGSLKVQSHSDTEYGIGIYGDEEDASKAEAHDNGVPGRNLPRRHFLGMSQSDLEQIGHDIQQAQMDRLNKTK